MSHTTSSAKWTSAAVSLTALMIVTGVPASAAEHTPPPKPCTSPEYRQFDFWLGSWVVTQNGKPAGRNRIEAMLGGCALLESWTGVSGVTGHSLNIYDTTRDVWHQTWVDSSGALLTLEGRFEGGAMVLEGLAAAKGAAPTRQRITWTRQANGDVRQLWQSSADDGHTWKTEFDGLYKRGG
jgi:hypothetical protein